MHPLPLPPPATDAYRPDIDGLRAIAVAAVVLFHAFPKALPGGYVGVDIFFVISGFLISSILLRENAQGRFSLAKFYGRRIRRIFPALALCMTAVMAYGLVALLPSELTQVGKHLFFGAAFLSNIALWSESGYFDGVATLKPLLHLWSLGVEEQFYIVWPAAIWLATRAKVRMPPLLGFLFLASFLANILLSDGNIADAFYLPVARFWELLAGAWLALCGTNTPDSPRLRSVLSFIGLLLLVAAIAFFSPEIRFPGWYALVPVLGAIALIWAGPNAWVNRALLSHPAAVSLGLISYPLYIWHWPLISYAHIVRLGKSPTLLMSAGLVVASVLLAWLTYRFVEQPIRFGTHRHRRTVVAASAVAVLGTCGLAAWINQGFPQRFPPLPGLDMQKISTASVDEIFKPTPAMAVEEYDKTLITHLGSGTRKLVLSGDSVMFHYGPRIQALADQGRLVSNVTFIVGASCAPVPGVIQRDNFAHCANMPGLLRQFVTREKPQTVVLGGFWPGYSGTLEIERHGQRLSLGNPEGQSAFYANLEDFVRELQGLGAEVHLVLTPPSHDRLNPSQMVKRDLTSFTIADDAQTPIPLAEIRQHSAKSDKALRQVAEHTGAILEDPTSDLCESDSLCSPFFGEGEPKFSDNMHLRPIFARQAVHFLDPLLMAP